MKKILLLVALTCCFHSSLLAQSGTIRGTVKTDGIPALGVNILLEGTTYGAATDQNGTFEIIQIPFGTYKMRVSAIGYVTQTKLIEIKNSEVIELDFSLSWQIFEEDEMVITASRREQVSREVPVSISILQPKELDEKNVIQLDDALRYVPGVQMLDNQVSIRGSSGFAYGVGSRIQLLVDGMAMLSAEAGNLVYELVPTSQIKQVEIIKGPGSALYGSGALGGVINIISKDFPDSPETDFKLHSGTYLPPRYDVWQKSWDEGNQMHFFGGATLTHARKASEKFGFWLNGNYFTTEGYLKDNNKDVYSGSLKLGIFPSPSFKWNIFSTYSYSEQKNFIFWQSAREALAPAEGGLLKGSTGSVRENGMLLSTMTHILSPNIFYDLKTRFYGVRTGSLFYKGDSDYDTIGLRYGAEVQFNFNLDEKGYGILGASLDKNASSSLQYIGTDEPLGQPETAIFGQFEKKINLLNLVAGLRYDSYVVDETRIISSFSPKFNVSYPLNPLVNFRASFGKGFRIPGVTERYIENNEFLPIISNPDLLPEQSLGYELGVKGVFPLGDSFGGFYDISGFYNQYKDLVEPKFQTEEVSFQFVNLTNGIVKGFESMIGASNKKGNVTLMANYTYLNGTDNTEETPLPLVFRSPHLFQASLSTLPKKWLSISVDYRYVSAFERIDIDFARFVTDADIHIPYHVLDARIGFNLNRLTIGFIAKNALDYYYMERPAVLAAPRNFIFQLSGKF